MDTSAANSLVGPEEKEGSGPEIREFYRDYKPRLDAKRMVEELLTAVPSEYLTGLKSIVLTNRSALSRDQRRQKIRQGGRNHEFAKSQGAYYGRHGQGQRPCGCSLTTSWIPFLAGLCEFLWFGGCSLGLCSITKSDIISTVFTSRSTGTKRT